MNKTKVLAGNTIKFVGEFYDYSGNLANPQNVKIIIYDKNWMKVEEITEGIVNPSTGIFEYEYQTKTTPDLFYYEFNGLIENKISLNRDSIRTEMI